MKTYLMVAAASLSLCAGAAQATDVWSTDLGPGNGKWRVTDLAGSASVTLTDVHTQDGDGAAQFNSPGSSGKASLNYTFNTPVLLSSLDSLSYDWFVNDASTTSTQQVPALKLNVERQGSFFGIPITYAATFVFEPTYQGTATQGSWVTSSMDLDSGTFWATTGSNNNITGGSGNEGDIIANMRTLSDWLAVTGDNSQLMITGLSFGIGSGWNGVFDGAIDHVAFNFAGGLSDDFNFKVKDLPGAVPEPATWAMMIGGFALAGSTMRRRRTGIQFA